MDLLPPDSLKKIHNAINSAGQEKKNTFGIFIVSDILQFQVQEYSPVV